MRLTTTGGDAAGGLFAALDLGPSNELVGIETPATWTAANLTFRVSTDGTNYFDLYDDGGTEVTITAAASRQLADRADMRHLLGRFRYVQVRSGTTGAPVAQAASRTLALYCVPRARA